MTTNAQSDAITTHLINQLAGIASTPTADGESRIKAAGRGGAPGGPRADYRLELLQGGESPRGSGGQLIPAGRPVGDGINCSRHRKNPRGGPIVTLNAN